MTMFTKGRLQRYEHMMQQRSYYDDCSLDRKNTGEKRTKVKGGDRDGRYQGQKK